MSMILIALAASFILIAVAELGDKTQLLTLGFSTRFPLWTVITAVSSATALLMGLAVAFGGIINQFVPEFYLSLLAGLIFIIFGIWTIFSKEDDDEDAKAKMKTGKNAFWFIFSTFFLAELGDKTQLAALALTAEYRDPLQVWLGATAGMALVNVIAAVMGGWLKKFVPERIIKLIGAALFIVFGSITLYNLFF